MERIPSAFIWRCTRLTLSRGEVFARRSLILGGTSAKPVESPEGRSKVDVADGADDPGSDAADEAAGGPPVGIPVPGEAAFVAEPGVVPAPATGELLTALPGSGPDPDPVVAPGAGKAVAPVCPPTDGAGLDRFPGVDFSAVGALQVHSTSISVLSVVTFPDIAQNTSPAKK